MSISGTSRKSAIQRPASGVMLPTATSLSAPGGRTGVVAVMWKGSTTTALEAGMPPTVTDAPGTNPLPVIVTGVPPESPESGAISRINCGSSSDTTRHAENSELDVRPTTTDPGASADGRTTAKCALPLASVSTVVEPIGTAPSP